jgi:8-oxo-dGTP pyrophosphatase MutT (NUDIX family)
MTHRRETSAGGVVFRRGRGRLEVAVGDQRDRLTGDVRTRLPKGGVEAGETLEQAALREVEEETGLLAKLVAPLETVDYTYLEAGVQVSKQVHFFLMELAHEEPRPRDAELERVYWCAIDEAAARLSFETEQRVLQRARERLGETECR